MTTKTKIDVSALKEDERCEIARLLFKCGYGVKLVKERPGNKLRYIILCEREGNV